MLDGLRSLLPVGGGTTVVRECRNCGRTLDGNREICPVCGREKVARYEIP